MIRLVKLQIYSGLHFFGLPTFCKHAVFILGTHFLSWGAVLLQIHS